MQGPKPTTVPSEPQFSSSRLSRTPAATNSESPVSLWVESTQEAIRDSHLAKMVAPPQLRWISHYPCTSGSQTTGSRGTRLLYGRSPSNSLSNNPSHAFVIGTHIIKISRPEWRSFSSHIRFVAVMSDYFCRRNPGRNQQIPVTNSLAGNHHKFPNSRHNSLGHVSVDDQFKLQPLAHVGNTDATPLTWLSVSNPQPKHDHRLTKSNQRQGCFTTKRRTLSAIRTLLNEPR
jgi:hypothetical protein